MDREYRIEQIAEVRKIQDDCLKLHVMPPPLITFSYKVTDADGKISDSGRGKANSFTRNAYNLLAVNVGMCAKNKVATSFADGYACVKRTSAALSASDMYRYGPSTYDATVWIGTGATETLDDYAELTYYCTTGAASVFDSTTRKLITTLTGTKANVTGSTINITEAGITCLVSSSSYSALMVHDVFDAVALPDGKTMTFTYVIEVAYPNP